MLPFAFLVFLALENMAWIFPIWWDFSRERRSYIHVYIGKMIGLQQHSLRDNMRWPLLPQWNINLIFVCAEYCSLVVGYVALSPNFFKKTVGNSCRRKYSLWGDIKKQRYLLPKKRNSSSPPLWASIFLFDANYMVYPHFPYV